jgi:regulator of cell morphogenesis and NO signaling
MNVASISGNAKMADILMANGRLIYMLPAFGIEMGFGEKTVEQVCEGYGVSLPLFLLVCNIYTIPDYMPTHSELKSVAIEDVVVFLQKGHRNYLAVGMPKIIESLLYLAEIHVQPANKNMLIAFCEKYKQDVQSHIRYEEDVVFSYIHKMLAGERPPYMSCDFEESHRVISTVLRDLRNIIIKYVPPTCTISQCLSILTDISLFESDLCKHSRLEELVLVPLIERLSEDGNNNIDSADLSERERQTLVALARGLSNKEIADKMNISIHTVVSHRKNIIRKTGIKTVQGLTIYAFINNLITHKDLR